MSVVPDRPDFTIFTDYRFLLHEASPLNMVNVSNPAGTDDFFHSLFDEIEQWRFEYSSESE